MGLKAVKLNHEEIQMAIDIHNNLTDGGVYVSKTNYDYIVPVGLKNLIEEKDLLNAEILSDAGLKVANAVYDKLCVYLKVK